MIFQGRFRLERVGLGILKPNAQIFSLLIGQGALRRDLSVLPQSPLAHQTRFYMRLTYHNEVKDTHEL